VTTAMERNGGGAGGAGSRDHVDMKWCFIGDGGEGGGNVLIPTVPLRTPIKGKKWSSPIF
jgi:hypothetical protein